MQERQTNYSMSTSTPPFGNPNIHVSKQKKLINKKVSMTNMINSFSFFIINNILLLCHWLKVDQFSSGMMARCSQGRSPNMVHDPFPCRSEE